MSEIVKSSRRHRPLTDREWTFCYELVKHGDWEKAYDMAFPERAGNSYKQKIRTANRLKGSQRCQEEMGNLRAMLRASQRVTLEQHLVQLARIRDKAIEKEQLAAAVRAEELRGKTLGFYVNDIRVTHELSANESVSRLRQLMKDNPKLRSLLPQDTVRRLDADQTSQTTRRSLIVEGA